MNHILENIVTRRSVRSFINKPISRENLDQIITAAIYAPSGMNRQSWHFTIIQNREKIQQLHEVMGKNLGNTNYNLYNAEVMILVSNERDNRNSMADCACALQNIFLMSHELGIGSVWINQLRDLNNTPEVREVLDSFQVPKHHDVYGMAALGYTEVWPEAKPRKENTYHYVD